MPSKHRQTISVVIPAYNEEHLLRACLESLAAQIRPADEIIVVDNNSTDATAAVAAGFGATVIAEPVQGIMPATVAGMEKADGDIIARCDADSILPVDWLQKIEREFARDDDVVAVTGPGEFYDTGGFAASAAQVWYMYAYFVLVGSALANWPLFGSNYAMRRRLWNEIAPLVHRRGQGMHDDIDFSMHIPPTYTVRFVPSLRVGISARSLRPGNLPERYKKGFQSLNSHWPEEAPWHRWRKRWHL